MGILTQPAQTLFATWRDIFIELNCSNDGSWLTEELKPYFSPYATFLRLKPKEYGVHQDSVIKMVYSYIDTYRSLVSILSLDRDKKSSGSRQSSSDGLAINTASLNDTVSLHDLTEDGHSIIERQRERQMVELLQYRIKNDPAKGLLTSVFGDKWTNFVLAQVFFPLPGRADLCFNGT